MNTLKTYATWIFWLLWYLPRREPKELTGLLLRDWRTRKPWWTWKPYLYRNHGGLQWEAYFSDDGDYTSSNIHVPCEVSFSEDTGEITALTIHDGTLKRIAQEERMRQAARKEQP